ncbi:protein phosphatase 1 regulatory subunit 36 [Clupea harengus]|uniref:Protein phosphatase 1 regulatory subunit 36 n=1 Tax=Clupea harengus TaxID=7950 RepID=A0A6P8H356_CLUHA|nr:protein phosphatase 1 regulatory subunit 36 [Clupea harengus]
MPKPTTETINVASPGRWTWNDEIQGLEFNCVNSTDDVKEKRKKRPQIEQVTKHQERFAESSRGRRKTLMPAQMGLMLISSLRQAVKELVTIEHVKQVALSLVQENEAIPIPLCFLSLMKCKELDEFLATLLLYLSCYFEKKSLEMKPKPLMAEPSVTEKQVMAETCAKVDLARKQLALRYSTLILGLGLSQQHHMACGKSKQSWTHRDRHLYECLYSFLCYVAWVTFNRKDLRGIQEEVGRLLRSDTFNPTLNAREPEGSEGQEEDKADPKEPGLLTTGKKKSERRPALSKIMTQRSPVMVSLLPSPREKAPHLFQRALPRSKPATKHCDTEELVEQLKRQLASFSFGILGKPHNQYSRSTLMPRWPGHDDDDDGEDDDDDDDDDSSEAHMRAKTTSFAAHRLSIAGEKSGSRSRANTVTSHATTEEPSSDTE